MAGAAGGHSEKLSDTGKMLPFVLQGRQVSIIIYI